MTSAFSWQNSISICPASFCTPRPHLRVTPGISTYHSSGKSKSKLQWDSISRLSEWLSSRRQQITNADEGAEKGEPLYTVGRIVNICGSSRENSMKIPQIIKNRMARWPRNFTSGKEDKNTNLKRYVCVWLSRIQLFGTLWTVAHQALLSMKFSGQEYWSGLSFPTPQDLPDQGLNPGLLHCRQILYHLSYREVSTFIVVLF